MIRLDKRDCLRDALRIAGTGSGIHYPAPVHRQPAYTGRLAAGPSGLGLTERAAPQILSLAMYPQFSDEAVERVIVETLRFFDSIGSLPRQSFLNSRLPLTIGRMPGKPQPNNHLLPLRLSILILRNCITF